MHPAALLPTTGRPTEWGVLSGEWSPNHSAPRCSPPYNSTSHRVGDAQRGMVTSPLCTLLLSSLQQDVPQSGGAQRGMVTSPLCTPLLSSLQQYVPQSGGAQRGMVTSPLCTPLLSSLQQYVPQSGGAQRGMVTSPSPDHMGP